MISAAEARKIVRIKTNNIEIINARIATEANKGYDGMWILSIDMTPEVRKELEINDFFIDKRDKTFGYFVSWKQKGEK